MSEQIYIQDFFSVKAKKVIGRSNSGHDITAIGLDDRAGKRHVAYHITYDRITEIFYDIEDAARF